MFVLITCMPCYSYAQIVIDTTLTVEELISDVLVGGAMEISSVSVQGIPNQQVCRFEDINNYLGIEQGIYMTTGHTSYLNEPSEYVSEFLADTFSSDIDLADLINGDTMIVYDAIIIEFDFVPLGNSISFNYVFVSEEYPEYVCSEFNDAFGFFLSGPGIQGPYSNGAINLATVPGTSLPVAINTINGGVPGINAVDSIPCVINNESLFINNSLFGTPPVNQTIPVIYNGFTVRLTASSGVQCGETYHIKLVIADVSDAYLDSGVFLEAKSFNSSNYRMDISGPAADNIAGETYEGCPLNVIFSRPVSEIGTSSTVQLSWSGTATNGLDYTGQIYSLFFPVGVDRLIYPFNVFDDNIEDGPESVIVTFLTSACNGTGITYDFDILDAIPFTLHMEDVWLPCGGVVSIIPEVSGGMGSYEFEWTTLSGTVISQQATLGPLTISDTGIYQLEVLDLCSGELFSQQIELFSDSRARIATGFEGNCLGDSVFLVNNSQGLNLFTWYLDGEYLSSQENSSFLPDSTGEYTVVMIASDSTGCIEPDTATLVISVSVPLSSEFTMINEACLSLPILFQSIDQPENSSFQWITSNGQSGDGPSFEAVFDDAGTYWVNLLTLTVGGCPDTARLEFYLDRSCGIHIPTAFTPDGDGVNDEFNMIDNGMVEFRLRIYNRWGNLLFETNSFDNGWNGIYQSEEAPLDTYVYTVSGISFDGQPFQRSGMFLLLR